MKRTIFRSMCAMALSAMLLTAFLIMGLMCLESQKSMKDAVKTEVRYLSSAVEVSGNDYLQHLASIGDGNVVNRISWISSDGTVIYDSFADQEVMENHKDRPEILKALELGSGECTRYSGTLAEKTYYYARRLQNGSVIRVASTMKSGFAAVAEMLPFLFLMAVVLMFATIILTEIRTKQIIAPINELNLDDPQADAIYDELSPLIVRLENQKRTIRRQLEDMREKQKEFTAITENMKEGFLVIDKNADVLSYNSSALRILGISAELVKKDRVNVLRFNRSANFRNAVDTALNGISCKQMLELNEHYYHLIANPAEEAENQYGAVVVILDVTEQKKREMLRREFSANVSHELKTPLTSISGYAEIMKNGMVLQQDVTRFAEKIYTEAQRMIALIGDIIRISQLDEGKAEPEKGMFDLHKIAADTAERLMPTAKNNGIQIVVKGSLAMVSGNERILNEMIFNLCENAVKYNRVNGKVYVETGTDEAGRAYVSVKDNGIGIPKEAQDRVFERFYRVDKSHSKSIGGTGLGLSIVKHGAAYHHASLNLESEEGKGTCIRIIF